MHVKVNAQFEAGCALLIHNFILVLCWVVDFIEAWFQSWLLWASHLNVLNTLSLSWICNVWLYLRALLLNYLRTIGGLIAQIIWIFVRWRYILHWLICSRINLAFVGMNIRRIRIKIIYSRPGRRILLIVLGTLLPVRRDWWVWICHVRLISLALLRGVLVLHEWVWILNVSLIILGRLICGLHLPILILDKRTKHTLGGFPFGFLLDGLPVAQPMNFFFKLS